MRPTPISRRRCLQAAGLALAAGASPFAFAAPAPPQRRSFRLKETAGLRRFGYPVHTTLPVAGNGPFRLELAGKPVPAQFLPTTTPEGRPAVALDFNSSVGPLETQDYVVHWGDGLEAGPAPTRGLTLSREGDAFVVANGNSLRYVVPDDLSRLVRSVKNVKQEFVAKSDAPGLEVEVGGRTVPLASTAGFKLEATRSGPFAVGLRAKGRLSAQGGEALPCLVELTFPSSKSWVGVEVSVDDPHDRVHALGFRFDLLVEGSPTLIDFGANDTVYGTLPAGERMVLNAGETADGAWRIAKGEAGGRMPLFARGVPGHGPAEGWAHLMDRSRCTAVGVAGFGRDGVDEMTAEADGTLRFVRRFAGVRGAAAGRKALRFWAHFVPMPVQIGALTSPQAMLAPLEVAWADAGE